MIVKVLVYGYAAGVFSSRKIQRRLYEDLAFRFLAAGNFPHHHTIRDFRALHLQELGELFVQVVKLAREMGLVKLGTVARERKATRPALVNFTALDSRISSIWRQRSGSETTCRGSWGSMSTSSARPLLSACGLTRARTDESSGTGSNTTASSRISPASMRERSSTSLVSPSKG